MLYNDELKVKSFKGFDLERIDFTNEYKTTCPQCESEGRDKSQDNLHVYGLDSDGKPLGANCFCCEFYVPSMSILTDDKEVRKENKLIRDMAKVEDKKLSFDEVKTIVENTSDDPKGWRFLEKKYIKELKIRFVHDTDGNPIEMLTPVTLTNGGNPECVGYKSRRFPKDFMHPKGYVGKLSDLIGYNRFRTQSRVLVIVAGEVDYASAYQMFNIDKERKGSTYETPAVVSPVNGEHSLLSTFKDSQTNFNFFKQFDKVIIAIDNDDVGKKVTSEFIEAMPREKLYQAKLRYKDANEYLKWGKITEWVQDVYWNATPCTVASIVGSGDWLEHARDELTAIRVPFPEIYKGLNDATRGGLPMGRYVIIAGSSSCGKTTHINTMIKFWMKYPNVKVGVLSLELTKGQYFIEMLSREIGVKIDDITDNETRHNYLNREDVIDVGNKLFYNDDGTHTLFVVDDRDSKISTIQALMEDLVIKQGCNLIVADPISDLMQQLDNQQQVVLNSWIKSFIKKHNILLVGISHVKKGDKKYDEGDIPNEGDLIGSYANASSAAAIFFCSRNKMTDNIMVKNTTLWTSPKVRWTGRTGTLDKTLYVPETHSLVNLDDYLSGGGVGQQLGANETLDSHRITDDEIPF